MLADTPLPIVVSPPPALPVKVNLYRQPVPQVGAAPTEGVVAVMLVVGTAITGVLPETRVNDDEAEIGDSPELGLTVVTLVVTISLGLSVPPVA